YQQIASKINEMIPVEWERVYTMAYIDDQGGEVFLNFIQSDSNDIHYYTSIPDDYNVSERIFDELSDELYENFDRLRELFIENNQ
ncbi:TIGR01741 family protein, partial [Staphylococcus epidermidis]